MYLIDSNVGNEPDSIIRLTKNLAANRQSTMKLELDHNPNVLSLQFTDTKVVHINGSAHSLPIAFTPEKVLTLTIPAYFEAMEEQHWQHLLDLESSVVLCGTGSKVKFLPVALEESLRKQGSCIDLMTTAAACRTFTLLSNDNRDVVALLFGD